jgi:hypothetical protein
MKKIIDHLKADWYKYLLEGIVITAGILGAFSLGEWRENRNNRLLESEYYLLLKSELVSDTLNIVQLIEELSKSNDGFEILIDNINEEILLPEDSVLTLYLPMFYIGIFKARTETFESIKSSGHLSLIRNFEIKHGYYNLLSNYEIADKYYDQRVMKVSEDVMFKATKYFAVNKMKFYDMSYVYSQEGVNTLTGNWLVRRGYMYNLSKCLKISRELIALIDKEIKWSEL